LEVIKDLKKDKSAKGSSGKLSSKRRSVDNKKRTSEKGIGLDREREDEEMAK
jgi:hypothetical protein